MNKISLKSKLQNGGRVFGTFFQYTTNPAVLEILPASGLDFVIVTVEHNALDLADFLPLRWALHGRGIACLARIHSRDPEDVARACDAFADGVVIPYAEDVDELKQLVAAAKYRPLKGAALGRLMATGEWPSTETRRYIEQNCVDTFFCAMIESRQAVDDIEQICAVSGIDALLVGPNDLTVSLGVPEERDHPVFVAAVQQIIEVGEKHGIAAGAHFSHLSHAQRLIDQGGRFIPFTSDIRILQAGIAGFLKDLGGESIGVREKII